MGRAAQITLALLILGAGSFGQTVTITHGPILGHVGTNEIYIWARTSLPGPFQVRYGLESRTLDQVSQSVTVIDRDNTGWAHLTGLKPDTKYYYQLVASGTPADPSTRSGSFRTLPDAASFRDPQVNPTGLFNFRFEFGSCNNQNPGQSLGPDVPAFRTMLNQLRDKVHFSILNGDWLYEARREYTVEEWVKQVQLTRERVPALVRLAPSIVGVWENYKHFLDRAPNLAAWHRISHRTIMRSSTTSMVRGRPDCATGVPSFATSACKPGTITLLGAIPFRSGRGSISAWLN
jgi:phosphodiesterase/alkaline phosphatase D-like protein